MRNIILSLAVFCLTLPAYAHGPTPQKAKELITINAPVAKVWEAIKQFDAIVNWHPDLKKSEGDGKNQSGGLRTLTFKNDASLVEELDYYSEQEHEYSYRLKTENTSAFPTSSHSVEIKVVHGDMADTSVVTLKSRFYRGDTGNTPPENLNDEAAVKAMTRFFKNGLEGLKSKVEQK
jgi:mxaD protein